MRMSRRAAMAALGILAGIWCVTAGMQAVVQARLPQDTALAIELKTPPPDKVAEEFLLKGRVTRTKGAGKGVTGSMRGTMTDGTITHDIHIQTIDEYKREFRGDQGTEFNFRDSWMFNVAAYRIARLLGIEFVPVSVERRWKGAPASYTWWVDDVMMDEATRLKEKTPPPDLDKWNRQMQTVRLFDQLIGNVDRNLGNLVITKDWNIWMIDHTRAFRTNTKLKSPGNIARCEREVFARLKALDKETVKAATGKYLQTFEIDSMLRRRDEIVDMIERRGDAGLFDGFK
jgi:hypothetical protein